MASSSRINDPEVDSRLAELASEYSLNEEALRKLGILVRRLAFDEHAATTVREPLDVVNRHVADSLTGLRIDAIKSAANLLDVGSGAGLPGLVLAVVRPDLRVVTLDSVGKKAGWVGETADLMGLTNLEAEHGRAEEFADEESDFDVVSFRAVAPLGVLMEYASPLLKVGGSLVAWKGSMDEEETSMAVGAAKQLKMSPWETVATTPWPGAEHHCIVTSQKLKKTPAGFPRRSGMARKKPLGA